MPHSPKDHVSVTAHGMMEGARVMIPLMPGLVLFGMAFGAAAAQKGFSLLEASLSSGLVFAGLAQMVALEGWTKTWTPGGLLALAFLTMAVNMRHFLMSASMRPWLGQLPGWKAYPSLLLMADNNWAAAMRYRANGGSDAGFFIGSGIITWFVWVASTAAGQVIGGGLPDPKKFAIDVVVPAFFVAMLVPNWKGRREAVTWGVAAAVSVGASFLLPGWWFIVIGAVAGAVAGGFADDKR
ncbi:AzlC family ABC transporter permease [Azorhizobium caulinodans]|uniref:Putative branched-chain amino acid transport protein n=1 Tax=Azorhizobium caulinodans (strain ATCC 43989 / DSM 5975 / JCM 20966 / LMG 6465 / NBRC 14845 / NCIMB 13405 / ORS 571) TaxID=438753 RepID=A8IGG3_AZOC5|nr:AzlC family ABC transporter permease [Azorhizobium caulinodans]BAF86083.1 putative branched-chain amino acid transport protein [Azorhizobium caulinodans ORS 571]